jgi:hypothetical protein
MLSFRPLLRDPGLWILVFGLACYTQLNFQDRPNNFSSTFTSNNTLGGMMGGGVINDGPWKRGAPLVHERRAHRSSVLKDGRILISGGLVGIGNVVQPNRYLASSEIYDPEKKQWRQVSNLFSRFRHTSTALPSGEAILIGGQSDEESLGSTEIFDPSLNEFRLGPSLRKSRRLHTATLLSNGNILVAGGYTGNARSTAYLYPYGPYQLLECEEIDPLGLKKTVVSSMKTPRELHTATRLADGRVLVTGGVWGEDTLNTCEIYDPQSRTWTSIEPMVLPRTRHVATLLPDGRVLVIGGSVGKAIEQIDREAVVNAYSSCEIYDPATGRWTLTDSMRWPRTSFMDALLLPNHKVLVAGGYGAANYESNYSWELYDIASGTWDTYGTWSEPIHAHRLVFLPQYNQVLQIGGLSRGQSINSTRILDLSQNWFEDRPEIQLATMPIGRGPLTQIQITANFKEGSAVLWPQGIPIESGQMSTVMIDRETSLTVALTQQRVVVVRKFKIQPRPGGQQNNGRTKP